MRRVFLRLLLPVCLVVLGAGAQPDAQAPGLPGASAPPGAAGAPGTLSDGQPAEAPVKPVPAVLPAVVAKVNGEDIQKWELESALKQAEATAGGPGRADKRDAALRGILDELVTYHLLAQEAHGRKMDVSDTDVEAEMLRIRQNFPTEEAYKQALLLQGVTVEQLRDVTRRTMQAKWPARCFVPVRLRVYITVDTGALDSDGGGSARR